MSKWKSAMPLEFGPRRGPASYAGGAQDMPDGVFPPDVMARSIVADQRRGQLARWTVHQRPGSVVTIAGTDVPEQEIAGRARLFERIRQGDRPMAADAAQELWETRRAWIIPGAQEEVGREPKQSASGRGAGDGPVALPTTEEA